MWTPVRGRREGRPHDHTPLVHYTHTHTHGDLLCLSSVLFLFTQCTDSRRPEASSSTHDGVEGRVAQEPLEGQADRIFCFLYFLYFSETKH